MNKLRRFVLVLIVAASLNCAAQTFPQANYFRQFFVKPRKTQQLPGPQSLEDYVVDGKLRLSLEDAIRLALVNNTELKINELQTDLSQASLLKSQSPFDPQITTSFFPSRSTQPATSSLQGAQTVSSLTQNYSSVYSQLLGTGTQFQVTFAVNRSATNSIFSFFNPAIGSALTVNFAQPLLRNRGWYVTRAPIVIAQRNLKQSRANFAAQVNDAISRVVNDYWDVVQAQQGMVVLQKSLELAEATYKQDKRKLELGALPPLDIYRSESQVAQRKLQLIQSEYQLKQTEDEFRRTIGADLDLRIAALDLDLTEPAEPIGALRELDFKTAIEQAMQSRPELESVNADLANAETNIRVATNALKPDLSLSTFYTMNGRGGNLIDSTTGDVIARTGLVDSFDQVGGRDYPAYGMGLTLRLPLKNRSAEADLGTALANQRRSLYQQRQRQQAIVQDVRNAANQLEEAKLSIAAAKLNRDLSQKNLEAEQRKYELGAEPIFFVLDAQTQLAQAEQSLVQAEIGYQRAVTAVDRATGELLERHRVQLATLAP